jgi:integrase
LVYANRGRNGSWCVPLAHSSRKNTIRAGSGRYLSEDKASKKPTTQRSEGVSATNLICFLGSYSLTAVNLELVASYRDHCLAQGKSNNTVRIELALLSNLLTIGIQEWGLGLIFNPVVNIRKPRLGGGRQRRMSKIEEKILLEAVNGRNNQMFGWIGIIAIENRMGQPEILNIRRPQIDLKKHIVRLFDTKNDSSHNFPLTMFATRIFTLTLNIPVRPIDTDLVFFGEPGRDGKRSPYQFVKVWGGIKSALGMSDLHFHDLRHEAVSRLVEGGLSDQEVASISGHKSMQMLRRYTHPRAEELVSKLDKMSFD